MVGYGKQARAPRRRSLEWERQPGPRLVRAAMVYARRRSWKRCLLEVVAVAVKAYSGTCIGRKRKPHRQGLTLFLPALGTCLGPARPPGQTGSWKKVRGGRPQHRSYSVGKRCSTRGLVLKGDPWRHRALRPVPHTALLPAARGPPRLRGRPRSSTRAPLRSANFERCAAKRRCLWRPRDPDEAWRRGAAPQTLRQGSINPAGMFHRAAVGGAGPRPKEAHSAP